MKGRYTMTLENGMAGPPPAAILQGAFDVVGKVTVNFDDAKLVDWFRRERGRQENTILRMARPHLPKRVWQRLRGRMKAKWRAS